MASVLRKVLCAVADFFPFPQVKWIHGAIPLFFTSTGLSLSLFTSLSSLRYKAGARFGVFLRIPVSISFHPSIC